jgi:hypothetical protein
LTPYFEKNPETLSWIPKITEIVRDLSPQEAAEAIVRGVERNQPRIVIPFMIRLLGNCRLIPSLVERLVIETGWSGLHVRYQT